MNMKQFSVLVAALGLAVSSYAAVSISNVKVQQRWPWNGLVDIDYTVTSDNPDDSIFVYPLGKDNDRNIAIAPKTLTGEGVQPEMRGARVTPGTHRMTWNMGTDEPKLHSSSFTMTLQAVKGAMYLVVDLSGGPSATSYPIRYSDTPPDIQDNACRSTNLWLRLCLPGTFTMGSPSDELGREKSPTSIGYETLHQVTLTKPFYMGVFEVTQKQYALIMGTNPNNSGDFRPVYGSGVGYETIRGNLAGQKWPEHAQVDPESFMGVLRAKTGCLFDLPTEAQWEYACRAGASTAYNNGKKCSNTREDPNCADIARHCLNCNTPVNGYTYSGPTAVGQYKSNAWGLYDMSGNVAEWCLDNWSSNLGSAAVTDPKGPVTGSERVVRGGSATDSEYYGGYSYCCRSASRLRYYSKDYTGFRLAVIPVVE